MEDGSQGLWHAGWWLYHWLTSHICSPHFCYLKILSVFMIEMNGSSIANEATRPVFFQSLITCYIMPFLSPNAPFLPLILWRSVCSTTGGWDRLLLVLFLHKSEIYRHPPGPLDKSYSWLHPGWSVMVMWSPATALFLGLIMPQYSPLAVPICHTPSCLGWGPGGCEVSCDWCVLVFGVWELFSKASWYFLSQGGVAQPAGRQQLKWPFLQFTTIKPFLCGLFLVPLPSQRLFGRVYPGWKWSLRHLGRHWEATENSLTPPSTVLHFKSPPFFLEGKVPELGGIAPGSQKSRVQNRFLTMSLFWVTGRGMRLKTTAFEIYPNVEPWFKSGSFMSTLGLREPGLCIWMSDQDSESD